MLLWGNVKIEKTQERTSHMNTTDYGNLNAHTIGVTLKEIVRRAMEEIHKRRINCTGYDKKVDYKPGQEDRVTDADIAAQGIFIRKLEECFPGFGIVAEEQGFSRPCTLKGTQLFFTVDPLDGTKAFERRQSHGFGPMLSLSTDEEVIAAFVGEIMTGELYYYRPESPKVHRLNFRDHQCESLKIDEERPLATQYVLLRDNPLDLPESYRQIAQSTKHGGYFKDIEINGGGIGTGMARLWKGEVGAYITKPGLQTPWDLLPVWGISEKLGFLWCHMKPDQGLDFFERSLKPSMKKVRFDEPTIIIHRSRLSDFTKHS